MTQAWPDEDPLYPGWVDVDDDWCEDCEANGCYAETDTD